MAEKRGTKRGPKQKNKNMLIACAGNATVGKNCTVDCFKEIFPSLDIVEHSFALELRLELAEFVKKTLGISVFTKDPEEKKLIRPLLVAWGKIRRIQSNGTYWWKKIDGKVTEALNDKSIVFISDCRYMEYPGTDEYYWLKKKGGKVIYVTRFDENGVEIPPANDEEYLNGPKIKLEANYHLSWETTLDRNLQIEYINKQLPDLIAEIRQTYNVS